MTGIDLDCSYLETGLKWKKKTPTVYNLTNILIEICLIRTKMEGIVSAVLIRMRIPLSVGSEMILFLIILILVLLCLFLIILQIHIVEYFVMI